MSDDEWKYGLDDVGPESETEASEPDPVEAGSPKPEHVLFFVLGVLTALGAFYAFLF